MNRELWRFVREPRENSSPTPNHTLVTNRYLTIYRNDGSVIGMFCCQRPTPNKSLNDRDVQVMKVFADIAAKQIERDLALMAWGAWLDMARALITPASGDSAAVVFGWYAARRWRIGGTPQPRPASREYLAGLNFLVQDQPDRALEAFLRAVEVDRDTVEMHLALGALYRRRGEIDRAIRVHQNLIGREDLEPRHREQATYALAQDYLKAGLHDRAEKLLEGLAAGGAFRLAADTGNSIIPAVILNTKKVLPVNRSFYFMPHRLELHFLPPIAVTPGTTADQLKEQTYTVMLEELSKH